MPVVKESPCGMYKLLNGTPVQVSNGALFINTFTGYPVVVVVVVDDEVVVVVHASQAPTIVIVAFGDVGTVILQKLVPLSGSSVIVLGN